MLLPSDHTLDLIGWLSEREPEALRVLAQVRGLTPGHCESLVLMADALLSPENVTAAFARLPRAQLHQLHQIATGAKPSGDLSTLVEWGFIPQEKNPTLLCSTTACDVLLSVDWSLKAPAKTRPHRTSQSESMRAATTALQTLCQLEDLLHALDGVGVAISKENEPTATGHKTLVAQMDKGVDGTQLVRIALTAGLLQGGGSHLRLGAQASSWLEESQERQWHLLTSAWWAQAPLWLRGTLAVEPGMNWGEGAAATTSFHYPFAILEPSLTRVTADAHALGITCDGFLTPWGAAVIAGEDGTHALADTLPDLAQGVYANEDFTLLAPGPLSRPHRSLLNMLASRELGGLVPRYRLTQASLMAALQRGQEPSVITSSLESITLTPLPSGMRALIDDTIRRSGDITLEATGHETRIVLRSAERAEELLADPRLAMLSLRGVQEKALHSGSPIERVHQALVNASYPALIDSAYVTRVSVSDHDSSAEVGDSTVVDDAITVLIASLEDAKSRGVPPGLGSMIEVAVRGKTPLEVVVEMPDGTELTIIMEPRALGGGRLRGVELGNQMERTLPVSRIRHLRPAPTATPQR